MGLAYGTEYGLYQHSTKSWIAGTKDFPRDRIDDSKLPVDDTLNKNKTGRDADAYYRNHHAINTLIRHYLGGSVALALEKHIKKKATIHMVYYKLTRSVLQL